MALIPPDIERCQAEKGGAFTLGPGKMRCTNTPQWIVHEKEPGPDGYKGSMSLCVPCLAVFFKQNPDNCAANSIEEYKALLDYVHREHR